MNNLAWLCIGDFNEILDINEKWGGTERSNHQILDFRKTVEKASLCDIGFTRNRFTWSKGKNQSSRIFERLDRALAIVDWCLKFPNVTVSHLTSFHSDHNLVIITTVSEMTTGRRRKKLNRF